MNMAEVTGDELHPLPDESARATGPQGQHARGRITRILRPRFGLRGLLVVFVLFGIFLVLVAIPYERRRRQRLALERIGDVVTAEWEGSQVVALTFQPGQRRPLTNLDGKLPELKHLPYVRRMSLELCRVSDAGLEHLQRLPQLEKLTFGGTFHLSEFLDVADYLHGTWRGLDLATPAGLRAVQNDAGIGLLILRNADVSDDGMQHVAKLNNLRILSLHNTGVSDEGLKELAALPHLEELDLRLSLVSDEGIKHLLEFPALAKLDLGNNRRLSGACLPTVARLEHLTELRLPYATIDDDLPHLHSMQNLRVLDLTERQVSDEAVEALQKHLPQCKIKL